MKLILSFILFIALVGCNRHIIRLSGGEEPWVRIEAPKVIYSFPKTDVLKYFSESMEWFGNNSGSAYDTQILEFIKKSNGNIVFPNDSFDINYDCTCFAFRKTMVSLLKSGKCVIYNKLRKTNEKVIIEEIYTGRHGEKSDVFSFYRGDEFFVYTLSYW